jgi:hypothetical protein
MGDTDRGYMVNHRVIAGVIWTLLAFVSACAPMSTVQRAETLGKGGLQVGIEPALVTDPALARARIPVVPRLDVSVRYGLSERLDGSLRLGPGGLELGGKWMLVPPGTGGPIVSLAPSLSAQPALLLITGEATAGATLPVLVGFQFHERLELIGSVRMQQTWLYTPNGFEAVTGLGASAGLAVRLFDGVEVLPEFAIQTPIAGLKFKPPDRIGDMQVQAIYASLVVGILLGGPTKR